MSWVEPPGYSGLQLPEPMEAAAVPRQRHLTREPLRHNNRSGAHHSSGLKHRRLRHAVCVTGLEREYSEISRNLDRAIFGLLNRTAVQTVVRVFGVRPPNDNWTHALNELPFTAVGTQRWSFCYPEDIPLPFWFTCSRGGKTTRMGLCTRSFMQVMCDLEHCEHLIREHEARVGQPFDFVTRIRLDVAWEAELPVPARLAHSAEDAVHVPHMNGQGGTNDKFVMGTRRAMAAYLNRTAYFHMNGSFFAWVARPKNQQPFAFDCGGSPGGHLGMQCRPNRWLKCPLPCLSTAPHRRPWTAWRLGSLVLRTPERRASSLDARRGLRSPPPTGPTVRMFRVPPPGPSRSSTWRARAPRSRGAWSRSTRSASSRSRSGAPT